MADVYLLNSEGYSGPVPSGIKRARPWEMSSRSEAIAPAGCPIQSTCFIVDKSDVAICDGQNNWFVGTNSIPAGQPFSDLF